MAEARLPGWCRVCEEEPATETSALGPVCLVCLEIMMAIAANAGRDALRDLKKEIVN